MPTTAYWVRLSDGPSLHVTYDQRHTLCGRDIPPLRFDGSDRTEVMEGAQVRVGVPVCRDCYRCT